MIIHQISTIPSSNLYWSNISEAQSGVASFETNLALPINKSKQLGLGKLPIGKNQAQFVYANPALVQILPNNGNQTSTPKLYTTSGVIDYTIDETGNVQGSDEVSENINLALRTNYNSSSVSDFGLEKRAMIPINYQNIISQDVLVAIQPLIDQGLISDVNITITKQNTTIFANISYTTSGKKSSYKYGLS